MNYSHYNLDKQPIEIQKLAADHKLYVPLFVGQGATYSVGSDSYGRYLSEIKDLGNKKKIYGFVRADSKFGPGGWTDGDMECNMPACKEPEYWIIQSGKWKKSGLPKFYFCDKNGKKFNGQKCTWGFNGAHEFRDPNF